MLKTVLKQSSKVLKGKLNKLGLEEKLAKRADYLEKAKEIWAMINKDLGISYTVVNKVMSKVDKFEKALLAKFPELSKDDVIEIKQSIIGDGNASEDVLDKVDVIKQLQEENDNLKNQLSKFQGLDTENTVTTSNETDTTTNINV
ncbi:hypothetical protein psyc5s11_45520 [Clostridium gelidum]|uniref:Uncharacterized protein n=1 Tax=Clostridium gelidum TaxID=704125 RepID=A0ABM7TBD0_9CLOT|nr:hypothetical protein [Clostridium gelidum]BCZ48485.1 hypothetical protein psyc5s11_45520 [Clostridium gelidum]